MISKRYDNGLQQLESAGAAVVTMQEELTALKPQLLISKKETEEMQVRLERSTPMHSPFLLLGTVMAAASFQTDKQRDLLSNHILHERT